MVRINFIMSCSECYKLATYSCTTMENRYEGVRQTLICEHFDFKLSTKEWIGWFFGANAAFRAKYKIKCKCGSEWTWRLGGWGWPTAEDREQEFECCGHTAYARLYEPGHWASDSINPMGPIRAFVSAANRNAGQLLHLNFTPSHHVKLKQMFYAANSLVASGVAVKVATFPVAYHVSVILEAEDGRFYTIDPANNTKVGGLRFHQFHTRDEAANAGTGQIEVSPASIASQPASSLRDVAIFLTRHRTLVYEVSTYNCQRLALDVRRQFFEANARLRYMESDMATGGLGRGGFIVIEW
eukprot:TRINITY_DN8297_c0_g1_i1.p1 TRINITY_DN8297_c0_g1~~TRINITY_DN8297_c0_g1_i1.p1  ORF type:complete len:318 (+),score=14.96 TRINITY_DN8297_c0_g1_i1:62-955(+)